MKHGTRNAYANRGCRCAVCRRANTAWGKRHLLGVYLSEEDKARFTAYVASQSITPSAAVRRALQALYEREGVA